MKQTLLAHVHNAVPAFDHGARLANNALRRRVARPSGPIISGAIPRTTRVVSPHGIPRKTTATKDSVRPVKIGPDHNMRTRLGLFDRQRYAALRGPAEG